MGRPNIGNLSRAGRPKGRSNGLSMTRILASQLKLKNPKSGIRQAQELVSALIATAYQAQDGLPGGMTAMNTILERIDGKVPDQLHVSQEPVVLRIESNAGIPRVPIDVTPLRKQLTSLATDDDE